MQYSYHYQNIIAPELWKKTKTPSNAFYTFGNC